MTTEILIIGAGPSGTMAASMIRQAGLNTMIIEKEQFPRYVIGESLLPRCMDLLDEGNYLKAIEKQNFQKKFGAVFIRRKDICEFNFNEQYTQGCRTWTWQVPRDKFDKVLADEAVKKGVEIHYKTEATGIEFFDNKQLTHIRNSQGIIQTIESRFIIDASGYGRVIPRMLHLDLPSSLALRSSLFTQVEDIHRPGGVAGDRITIVELKQGVWIWIIPFSSGKTSVGVVAPPGFFGRYEGSNEEKLRHILNGEPNTIGRFKDVPYAFDPVFVKSYSIAVKQLYGNGWALTGNASEFLDPVFSSGVTFAMESGWKAGTLAARQLKGETVDWDKEYVAHIMQGVEVFRTYVNAWYDDTLQTIFFSDTVSSKIKAQICSVLAGYVWDKSNPFVRNHRKTIYTLGDMLKKGKI